MAKTLIDIDAALLEAARAVLGTATKKDTVHAALREVIDQAERAQAVEALVTWGQRHEPWDDSIRDGAWQR